ncbi:MAG TPA: Xaa-Pro peptidase family protein, partial [Pyrinomonadaceae bacterium]|nr:Xaa-Pro peptidase family protein [Pyrinomonadaceae bacterium]
IERIKSVLRDEKLDAVVCALPANVLLLSGYWPVVGTSLCLTTRDGRVFVAAPGDEFDLAKRGDEDRIHTFRPSSLDEIRQPLEALRETLGEIARELDLKHGRVGYECGPWSQPASYAAMNLYGASLAALLKEIFPRAALVSADEMLHRLRAVKTPQEVERIRKACRIAGRAFAQGARLLRPGLKEFAAVNLFLSPLGVLDEETRRAGGFVYCMSGANSALACAAYARSRATEIAASDLVLVHCNSYADGYWTDITRTFYFDEPTGLKGSFYEAVSLARQAALSAIRPGVCAREVDRAARETLKVFGYEKQFKHSTGHGVGFTAIDANARPRLHPKSDDVLETGMVFNVEPAIYVGGYGGLRHCDVVTVTETGVEVLTPFQTGLHELQLVFDKSAKAAHARSVDVMALIGGHDGTEAQRLTHPINSTALMRAVPFGALVRRMAG